MMWISLILKNGIKVVMWYSFVGYFGLQVGNMCWFLFNFVCLVGKVVFEVKSYSHYVLSYSHYVDNFFSINIRTIIPRTPREVHVLIRITPNL